MDSKIFIGCCGAYCKTCRPYITGQCKGCKLGYDTGERNIKHARCKIKLCCFKDKKYSTCADCPEIASCEIIGAWYSRNDYKNKKHKQATDFIKKHGYQDFIKIADEWKSAYGKYK